MVWHSYQLNPRFFYEDCIRLNHMDLWGLPLPWKEIVCPPLTPPWGFVPW